MRTILPMLFLCLFASPLLAWEKQYFELPGEEAERRIKRLFSAIDWHTDRDALMAEAEEKNKLAFWIQIVGDLDGGL